MSCGGALFGGLVFLRFEANLRFVVFGAQFLEFGKGLVKTSFVGGLAAHIESEVKAGVSH